MGDKQFYFELWFNCYVNQIDGYPFGHPLRKNFEPIVFALKNEDGSYNRAGTISSSTYTFTDEQKAALLERKP